MKLTFGDRVILMTIPLQLISLYSFYHIVNKYQTDMHIGILFLSTMLSGFGAGALTVMLFQLDSGWKRKKETPCNAKENKR